MVYNGNELLLDGSTGGGVIPIGTGSATASASIGPRRVTLQTQGAVTINPGGASGAGFEVVVSVNGTFVLDVDCTVQETTGGSGPGAFVSGVPAWIGRKALAGTYPLQALTQIRRVGSDGSGTTSGSRSITQIFTPSPCRPDIDGTPGLTPADVFLFLSEYFVGRGDFNRDGTRNPTDIFDYLSAYFARC